MEEVTLQDKVFGVLESLASQLGTTIEFLWGVLLKQAVVSGVMNVVWALVFFVIFITTLIYFIKAFVPYNIYQGEGADRRLHREFSSKWKYWEYKYDGGVIGVAALLIITIIVSFSIFMGTLDLAVTAFVNPEYWALQKVLEQLR